MGQPTRAAATAGLILAAGLGTRFGGRKLLAPIYGKPMLQHVLDVAAQADLEPVVVVLGTDADELLSACTWRKEARVINAEPSAGIARSVQLGLAELALSDAIRVAVLLGDQPFLSKDQLLTIMRAPGSFVVPRFEGRPGNPVVLDRAQWPKAVALEGDRGFSQLFALMPDLITYVDVPGANPDIDSVADLAAISRA